MRAVADAGPEIGATTPRRVELSEIDHELRQLWGPDAAESGASARACTRPGRSANGGRRVAAR